MDYAALGKRVRTRRKMMGLTQEALAEKLGISCSFVGHIERGSRKMSMETLIKLSDVMGVSCDFLLQDSLHNAALISLPTLSEKNQFLLREIANLLQEQNS